MLNRFLLSKINGVDRGLVSDSAVGLARTRSCDHSGIGRQREVSGG